jgi:iron complex transport system substrate-binding protein
VQGLATRLIALAAAGLLMTGCDLGKSTPEETSHLRVAHANGETIVPPRADRVVTLVPDALDTAIALGVRPVGASLPAGHQAVPDYLGERAAGVKPLGHDGRPRLAAIRSLAPNLIIGYKPVQGRIYKRLSAIAPTVTTDSLGHADWELNTRLYSEALGRQAGGEHLLRDYDHRVARLKRVTGGRRGEVEVSLVRVVPGAVRVYNTGSFAGSILNDAGIGRPGVQGAARPYFVVPPAQMSRLDGDLILVSRAPGSGSTYRRLTSDPRWRALRGVRAGHVHQVNDSAWYVGDGMLAARVVMYDLARLVPRG